MRWTQENMAGLVRWGHDEDNKDILRRDTAAHFKVYPHDWLWSHLCPLYPQSLEQPAWWVKEQLRVVLPFYDHISLLLNPKFYPCHFFLFIHIFISSSYSWEMVELKVHLKVKSIFGTIWVIYSLSLSAYLKLYTLFWWLSWLSEFFLH